MLKYLFHWWWMQRHVANIVIKKDWQTCQSPIDNFALETLIKFKFRNVFDFILVFLMGSLLEFQITIYKSIVTKVVM